ncbi:hypothetical protein JW948_05920 [bacterium]|nr:hypothetical protein [bacterium]
MRTDFWSNSLMILIYVLLNSCGALAVKSGLYRLGAVQLDSARSVTGYFVTLFKSPLTVLGIAFLVVSAFVWMTALSRMEISIAYPVAIGMNFLIITVFGLTMFHESLSLSKTIGLVMIFVSLFFLSRG